MTSLPAPRPGQKKLGLVIDLDICVGCHACATACKEWNSGGHMGPLPDFDPYGESAWGVWFNRIHSFEEGDGDGARTVYFPRSCLHCEEPACVTVCPTGAILVGDLNDPGSKVAEIVQREAVTVRRPEKGTSPGVFYKGAHQSTLDPLAARRPDGGLYAWATQEETGPGHVAAGHPARPASSAEALLSYDIPHHSPWGWRVSLYTWTKGVAAGGLLVPLILMLAGRIPWASPLGRWPGPGLALAFLAVTGVLLIWDLRHPWRFYLIFTRHHWRSWLVRGSFIIGAYGAAVVAYLAGSLAGSVGTQQAVTVFLIPLALAVACYTAYLFAQAKARDLWQNPLLPPHLAVQAVLAGAAVLLPFALWLGPRGGHQHRSAARRRGWRTRPAGLRGDQRGPPHRARPPGRGRDDPRALRPVLLAGAGRGGGGVRCTVDRPGRRSAGPARPARP